MTVYTNAAAPTTPTYTAINSGGYYIFDDSGVLFDDTAVQFDGNNTTYTNAASPTTPTYTNINNPLG
jgi:hypothetical protein